MNLKDENIVTFNKFQALSQMVMAKREYHVWPRGMGKSTGLLAFRAIMNFELFPRVPGTFQSPTYISLLTKTLPTVLEGFQRLGWIEDKDYVIGKKPPDHWDKPYIYPRKWDYFVSTKTGCGFHLVSQDRKGTSNGLSVGWMIVDEAKLINKEQIDNEAAQTLRGYEKYVGDHPLLYNQMFVTDQPTGPKQKWIHELKNESLSLEKLTLIVNLQTRLNKLEEKYYTTNSAARKKALISKMEPIHYELLELRRDSVYYSEPDVDECLRALGPRFVKEQKRILSDYLFYTSILNMRSPKIEGGFYGSFNRDIHTAEYIDYDYIDSFNFNLKEMKAADPWKKDSDLNYNMPLSIGLDYNSSICNIVVGQLQKKMQILNHLYVKWPLLLENVVQEFCNYYRGFPSNTVVYIYDHTALQGKNAVSNVVFKDVVISVLKSNGWNVIELYIGQTATHESRYHFINGLFAHNNNALPEISINASNCESLIIALENTDVKQVKNGFQKNKSAETDKAIDQEETTHVTDAFDTLVYGELRMKARIQNNGIGNLDTITI
jgi:hypothetical protein